MIEENLSYIEKISFVCSYIFIITAGILGIICVWLSDKKWQEKEKERKAKMTPEQLEEAEKDDFYDRQW